MAYFMKITNMVENTRQYPPLPPPLLLLDHVQTVAQT